MRLVTTNPEAAVMSNLLGLLLLLAPLLPALALPIVAIKSVGTFVSSYNVHGVVVVGACLLTLALLVFAVILIFGALPIFAGAALTALYLAYCYGVTAYNLGFDAQWSVGVAILSGLVGFGVGHGLAGKAHAMRAEA